MSPKSGPEKNFNNNIEEKFPKLKKDVYQGSRDIQNIKYRTSKEYPYNI